MTVSEDSGEITRANNWTFVKLKLLAIQETKNARVRRQFKAIGIDNYEVSAPESWNL